MFARFLRLLALVAVIGPMFSLALAAAAPAAQPGLTFHAAPKPLAKNAVVEDWPHFLGPHHNATTRESPLLDRWPESGPPVVWELATGEGYGCPALAAGKLVYFHRVEGKETIDCLEPETGRRLWRFDYPVEYQDRYGFSPGPRSSAVIDGDRVYTTGVTAHLHCLDLATGKLLWKRDLAAEFQIPQYFFGYGPTPFVWKDRLIINVGGKAEEEGKRGTCVAALDKLTGKTLWQAVDTWGADYASPVVARLRGRDVALVYAGGESRPSSGGLLALDAETGAVLERFPWRARMYETAVAATPLAIDDHRVLLSESYEKGSALLDFDEALKAKPAWVQRAFGLHWMMPLLIDGHLYGFAGRNPPDTEFKCLDLATGRVVWTDDTRFEQEGRVQSFFRASLLRAGERTFCLGEDGLFGEFELTPKGVTIRQRARLFSAQSAWTLPALHHGLLYVMQNTGDASAKKTRRMFCYDLRGQ
ncbi:MAG: PQQ-binding-like beta-propeller repeat protein [Verrucomicrobiota bacterium]